MLDHECKVPTTRTEAHVPFFSLVPLRLVFLPPLASPTFPLTSALPRDCWIHSWMSVSNPVPALRAQLASHLYLINKSSSYNLQLYLNSGLLAASLLCVLASLVIRWFRGTFWVFRRITTASGTWILPHPMIFFLIWESLFLIGEWLGNETPCSLC